MENLNLKIQTYYSNGGFLSLFDSEKPFTKESLTKDEKELGWYFYALIPSHNSLLTIKGINIGYIDEFIMNP